MSPIAGAWGQTRNRYTQNVAPGQTGGANAQGSANRQFTSGPQPAAQPQQKQAPQYGRFQMPQIQYPSHVDARFQRNVADLAGGLEQQMAQSKLDLSNMQRAWTRGNRALGEQRDVGTGQVFEQLGAANMGRSGMVGQGTSMVQNEYQRNIDELARSVGAPQQALIRQLMDLARKQYITNVAAESGLSAERKAAYEMANQAPVGFTLSDTLTDLFNKEKKGKK